MFPFQRVLNNHSWAKPVPAVASSMTIMLQSDNRALARQTSCLWPTLRIVSQCWLYVTVTAETLKSVKQKRCGIFILRFSYLIFSPLSWISKSNLFSCSDMNSLRLALSNAPQSCPSLYSANGSMFSRSVPVKRIGSWGGIQWVLTLWKLEHSWTSQCSRPPAMSPQCSTHALFQVPNWLFFCYMWIPIPPISEYLFSRQTQKRWYGGSVF